MSAVSGLIILLAPDTGAEPLWWKVADGRVVSLSESAARGGMDGAEAGPVMLVLPPAVTTIRRIDLDPALPVAQARAVAARKALEGGIAAPADMHAVALERTEDTPEGIYHVALIAREDLAHVIAWARHHGVDPDILLPAGAILPEVEEGYARAEIGRAAVVRGPDMVAPADECWMQTMLADAAVQDWSLAQVETALLSALEQPPVNLRSGAFARARRSGADVAWWKRIALWVGLILLATLLIRLVLIVHYEWSASRLDAKTVETARTVAPSVTDAPQAAAEVDRLLAAKGGGAYVFTGPLAGLMRAMQPVPGVSISALSLNGDDLLHATLASARAEDINTVLLAVQAAGYSITATSSTDPGGRVIAEITVKP